MAASEDTLLFYERFAGEFDSKMNMYDTQKRVSVFFDELLTEDITQKKLLDAGCGTGWFSKKACERGAIVTSMDLGENLLHEVSKKCNSTLKVGSILDIPFGNDTFDIVISSEVIEHTVDPVGAISEMMRVLKPGGILVVSTPNKLWFFSIWLANKLKLRPYQGLENWIWPLTLKKYINIYNGQIVSFIGVHLFPFVHPIVYKTLDFFHAFKRQTRLFCVNVVFKAIKKTN